MSELVTNVIQRVGREPPVTLVLETAGECLRGEQHDGSHLVPVTTVDTAEDESGRGLQLLASVAADWVTVLTASGKAVWCELPADPGVPCRRILRAEAVPATCLGGVGGKLLLLDTRSDRVFEASATDLVADLLYWVAARGGDPDGFLDRTQMHFEAEEASPAEAA